MKAAGARPLWGWSRPVGRVLSTAVVFGGLMILAGLPPSRPAPKPPPLRIDPNTAPVQVLLALPRIGPARAGAIVEARKKAPLRSPFDLQQRARGIGPVTTRAIEPYLRFPDTPDPALAGSATADRQASRGPR